MNPREEPTGDESAGLRNTRFEGGGAWRAFALCATAGFALGFLTNVTHGGAIAIAAGFGVAAILGVPVIILIGLDRLRGRRVSRDPDLR